MRSYSPLNDLLTETNTYVYAEIDVIWPRVGLLDSFYILLLFFVYDSLPHTRNYSTIHQRCRHDLPV